MEERSRKPEAVKANRLINEESPYLLQHAHNPVDWYPWSDEAFEKARMEDKPVFLSIGYSTCHWCHVMERESFEDEAVAALMNDAFVSIKVDREERPDIDATYMTVAQLMTGRGGWPLTIVMTPEKKPFFSATYIPKLNRSGMPGMMDLIPRICGLWENRRGEIEGSAETITQALKESAEESFLGEPLSAGCLEAAFQELADSYDQNHGGFGGAPKFPTAQNLIFLIRYWQRTGEAHALEMAENTLAAMRLGGIYDHVGFGFHRYSTDREWLVPHFEKMLYDQAMLCMAYLEAYSATGKEEYAETAEEVFTYVLRDLRDAQGGFHSAEDADSEGVEGKFYVWRKEEIEEVLGPSASDAAAGDPESLAESFSKSFGASFIKGFIRSLNVNKDGNYPVEATGTRNGTNILHLSERMKNTRDWRTARQRLFEAREQRSRPSKDDKILTDWNGLMIAALARGGRLLNAGSYTEAARRAADFILKRLRDPDGRPLHRSRNGHVGLQANLPDYAFLAYGLLEIYQATFELRYLQEALSLLQMMVEYFWDDEEGGFYFTPQDGEMLLGRRKESIDGAFPSGNSVALQALVLASRITADGRWEDAAQKMGRVFSQLLSKHPSAHAYFLTGGMHLLGPSYEIVVAGDPGSEETQAMLDLVRSVYLPNKVVIFKSDSCGEGDGESPGDSHGSKALSRMAPYTEGCTALDGKATAYVCRRFACDLPISDLEKLRDLLQAASEPLPMR